jgi:LacI family transcriptional regulator
VQDVTIYDIAKEAGVAASTVSRVVNNKPGIKAETREKVQQLLKEHNYTPNIAARGLVMQSTRMVGILIVDIRVTHHINSAFLIEQELTRKGYCCIIMSTGPEDAQKAEYLKILEERRVEGIILMGSMFMTETVRETICQHLPDTPIVMVNGYLDLPNVAGITVDEASGVEDCVDLLMRKGRRKIALIIDRESPAALNKQNGYLRGMRKNGVPEEEFLVYETGESSIERGYQITEQLLREHPDTEGIIYSVEIIAAGGLRAAQDLGYQIPENLAMIGIDNSIYGEICRPKLTTLDNRGRELSLAAARVLQEGLEGRMKNERQKLQCSIIEREST